MEEMIQHWFWEVDKRINIYNLFVMTLPSTPEYEATLQGKRFFYYSHAFFMAEDNCWYVTSTKSLPPILMVLHDGFLYGKYHNAMTDFEYSQEVPVNGYSHIEETVQGLCHFSEKEPPEVFPSIDDGASGLWYPEHLEEIFRWPPQQLDAWLAYITKGDDTK